MTWSGSNQTFALPGGVKGGLPRGGDWNGDGTWTVGVYAPGLSCFDLAKSDNSRSESLAVGYGTAGSGCLPVVGRWTSHGGWSSLISTGDCALPGAQAVALDATRLQPIVQTAIARWRAAGVPQSVADSMTRTTVTVVDLAGAQLGAARGEEILIDRDAAGHGWFVDPTPATDEEFVAEGSGGMQAGRRQAVDHIDLESVVMHELGHVAGLDDISASTLMSRTLAPGIRRMPGPAEIDSLVGRPEGEWWR
jgi:large repetitive protein